MMGDLAATIIAKSDQLNADDLISGPITVTVTAVTVNKNDDQPCSIFYEGDNGKPYKPNKGMRRLLMMAWNTDDSQVFIGRSMTLYRDPTVLWAGKPEGGIRISHLSHIDKPTTFAIMVKRGKREQIKIEPLQIGNKTDTFTLKNAQEAMKFAKNMDELKLVWTNKAMGPFRDELTGLLAQCKASFAEPEQGRAVEEHGDQNDGDETDNTPAWAGMYTDWKERIANADIVGTIIAIRGELKPHVDVLPTKIAHELYGLLDEAAAKFTTKGE
jgi:hypothetical protein